MNVRPTALALLAVLALAGCGGGSGGGSSTTVAPTRPAATTTTTRDQAAGRVRAMFHAAARRPGDVDQYDAWTAQGKRDLREVDAAYRRYLAMDPPTIDPDLADEMSRVYEALDRPADGARASEVYATATDEATDWARVAIFAYEAGQLRKGDLARRRALRLARGSERAPLRELMRQSRGTVTSGE
jgi:hypothetical protein